MKISTLALRQMIRRVLQQESYNWRDKDRRHRDEWEITQNPHKNRFSVRLPEPGSQPVEDEEEEEEEFVSQEKRVKYEQLPLPLEERVKRIRIKKIIKEVIEDVEGNPFGTGMYQPPGDEDHPLIGHT